MNTPKSTSSQPIQALVGLGNPGPRYSETRHNVGFAVLRHLADREGLLWQGKFKGEVTRWRRPSGDVHMLMPHTFMNLSGQSVQALCNFYQLPVASVLVIHDELDLPFGQLRLKRGGGYGGHNGLKSIGGLLGSPDFYRLRVGIGRPTRGDVSSWVLAPFSTDERPWIPDVMDRATEAVMLSLTNGVRRAMNTVNQSKAGATS